MTRSTRRSHAPVMAFGMAAATLATSVHSSHEESGTTMASDDPLPAMKPMGEDPGRPRSAGREAFWQVLEKELHDLPMLFSDHAMKEAATGLAEAVRRGYYRDNDRQTLLELGNEQIMFAFAESLLDRGFYLYNAVTVRQNGFVALVPDVDSPSEEGEEAWRRARKRMRSKGKSSLV